MSHITPPPKVKPFAAVFAGSRDRLIEGLEGFSAIINDEPDIVSPEFPVIETAYYEKEMGAGLLKIYVSWPRLINPEQLVELKLATMKWEEASSSDGHRLVNIDPGYIFSGGLVLSTGKFRGHRLPLGSSIWGELTLNFHQGQFMAFPWTYLDYQRPDVQAWLMMMRQTYLTRQRVED